MNFTTVLNEGLKSFDLEVDEPTRNKILELSIERKSLGALGLDAADSSSKGKIIGFIVKSHDGTGGGVSRKAKNVLNWNCLTKLSADTAVTGAGVLFQNPWIVMAGALSIWFNAKGLGTVELHPRHAIAMEAMWRSRTGPKNLLEDRAHKMTNEYLSKYGHETIDQMLFSEVLNFLQKNGCLKLHKGEIILIEKMDLD